MAKKRKSDRYKKGGTEFYLGEQHCECLRTDFAVKFQKSVQHYGKNKTRSKYKFNMGWSVFRLWAKFTWHARTDVLTQDKILPDIWERRHDFRVES